MNRFIHHSIQSVLLALPVPAGIALPPVLQAAPMQYQVDYRVDDCTTENTIGRGGKGDLWVANGFAVQDGGEIIVSIEASFSETRSWPLGVHLYDDPNDDWIPDDLVLLQTVETTFPARGACHEFPIPPTEVSGVFFVALSYPDSLGSMSYAYDFPFLLDHSSDQRKTWYVETSSAGSLNPARLPTAPSRQSDVPSYEGQYLIRATGIPKPVSIAGLSYLGQDLNCGLEWGSTGGAYYEILRAGDLTLGRWTALSPKPILADGPTCRSAVPIQEDAAYYRIRQSPSPAIFEADFEEDATGWVATKADPGHPTEWEWGELHVGPYSARSGSQAYGTARAGNYVNNAYASLRSPLIDLAGVGLAELEFWYIGDFGDYFGNDHGKVEILDSSESTLLESRMSGHSTWMWNHRRIALPQTAVGRPVYVRFTLDDYSDGYIGRGLYIDDVRVRALDAEAVHFFTEDIDAFNIVADRGDDITYGAQILPEASNPFGDGMALRMFDFSTVEKPELQGEFESPLLEPFRIDFQVLNQSVNSSSSAIRFRMGNTGQSVVSESRSALSLSFEASGQISAKYDTGGAVGTIKSTALTGVQTVNLIANGSPSETFTYSFGTLSRTLNPLCHDVFINGVLFNNPATFPSGMPFLDVAGYDPALGIQRFGLLGSSNANVDPDYVFDNIIFYRGEIAGR